MKQILVIDDDEPQRMLFKTILEKKGYQVTAAEDGMAAHDHLLRQSFDLVITDIFMPAKDGFEIINELRQGFSGVKVIAISGGGFLQILAPSHALLVAGHLGVDMVLEKPIANHELLSAVASLAH